MFPFYEGRNDYNKRYIRKDGKIIWGHHVVSHISTDNDLPQYTLVSCEDITEKKHIEENYDWGEIGERYLNLYQFLLKKNRKN